MVINDYYRQLPEVERVELRDKILAEAGIKFVTFYQKLRSGFWTKCEQIVIESIIKDFENARQS